MKYEENYYNPPVLFGIFNSIDHIYLIPYSKLNINENVLSQNISELVNAWRYVNNEKTRTKFNFTDVINISA